MDATDLMSVGFTRGHKIFNLRGQDTKQDNIAKIKRKTQS